MTRLGRLLAVSLVAALALAASPLAPAGATQAGPINATNGLKLTLTSLSPRVVTGNTTNIAVSGSVTNISDRRIDNVKVRLQVGTPVTGDSQLAAALAGTAPNDQADIPYQTIGAVLLPGQTANISITAALQGANSLRISQAGVYPLLVNVQGQPDFGGQARLAAANLLLPVLAPPGGGNPSTPAEPTQVSVLWPLIDDQPRIEATVNGQTVLSDDSLATSLAPDGRLSNLLAAAKQAIDDDAALGSAMCFVIDPDLLSTVTAMAAGYLVRTPSGGTQGGTGAAVAGFWLQTLRTVTAGRCVLGLPEADADLVALSRAGAVNLAKLALADSAVVGATLPASKPLSGVVWPVDGALDNATAIDLAGMGVHTVLLNQNAVSPTGPDAGVSGPVAIDGTTTSNPPTALLTDPVVSTALTTSSNSSNVDISAISAQNGIGAWTYRTVFGAVPGQTELIAPPRRWNASAGELQEFLDTVGTSLHNHFATAASLANLAGDAPGGPTVKLAYPTADVNAEISPSVTSAVVAGDQTQQDVLAAMNTDHADRTVKPSDLIDPLRTGLLRAVSSAWRDQGPAAAAAELGSVQQVYDEMTGQVRVVPTAQTYSLGSNNSRLPVSVTNSLRVDITVRVNLAGQSGLAPSAAEQVIPAGSAATLFLPVRMSRSGRFSVDVSVTTPGGTQLGQAARFEVVSGAYGTIILVITIAAFGALVLLAGRRIYRRLRSARGTTVTEPVDLPTLPGEVTVPNVPHLPITPPVDERQEPVDH
ncbi:MAG TPA: DUF6049 family protein [Pseudonocardiaceae bacterium]|nr:DUF6049 family protein [Pseudonocardiaceae bacterium]